MRADGIDVFVPHEQEFQLSAGEMTAATVFGTDDAGIAAADVLVAVLDGPVVDDGTACEIGLFTGLIRSDPRRLGIVGVLTDSRSVARDGRPQEGRGLNLFVQGCLESVGRIVTDPADVVPAVRQLGT